MDIEFNSNEDFNKLALSELRKRLKKVKEGGGAKNLEKLHAQGKLSARERIDYLLDKNTPSIEIRCGSSNRLCVWKTVYNSS